mmetsp:Transcript_15668/g.37756  ORF Transcript_15668/g.37756 Transcript_15668/m.37756 type:complete len:498 (+) Transcript_15668:63-1556(+)
MAAKTAAAKNTAEGMSEIDRLKQEQQQQQLKKLLKKSADIEERNSKHNLNKIQESWLKIMRSAKTKQLKKEVEIVSQNHERDVDRKDAILQMLDRDLDEAEEQHQVCIRSHLLNIDKLLEIQRTRLAALEEEFTRDVNTVSEEFRLEREELIEWHTREKRELTIILQQVQEEERERMQKDGFDHQATFEMIKNKNIEEDHQMRSHLEEKIEAMRDKCNSHLKTYRLQTQQHSEEYKSCLAEDADLSKQVERRLRQVERMQAQIQHWRMKIHQNKQECEERNADLRREKESIRQHFQELKQKMNRFRNEEKKRLGDLTSNARECMRKLKDQLSFAEKILKTAELCRKLETEREKVLPFYLSRDVDVDELHFDDPTLARFASSSEEELKEEVKETFADTGVDEWMYLDTFFRRYNKVYLDLLAVEKEKGRLNAENVQLRSILKQFLDGVSVNEDVMSAPNPLLVVNGRVNLNHMPVRRAVEKVVVEAAHHVTTNVRHAA